MASTPASHPGRAVGSPGWPAPAARTRATETLGERPRPSSSPSPTSPTRTTTVEDSRRIDPILVPGPPGRGVHLRPAWRGRGHATRVPPVDPAELADLIAPHVTDGGPGHAAGVYRDGALVAHAAAGCAVIEHDVPIGAGTVFDIASASKQVTAACLLLLQRDGLLSLDEDVRTYLPELLLPVPVTLRQCLSHTSGLREYYSLCELAGVPGAGMDEARLMRPLGGQPSLNFPPGTGWSYSNSGFVLAAAALRRVSGRSLAEFAADRVFGPLGMRATRFRDDLTLPVPGLATGYTPAPGGGWHRADITEETVG